MSEPSGEYARPVKLNCGFFIGTQYAGGDRFFLIRVVRWKRHALQS